MSLITSLVSYWKLDETSDGSGAVTRNDSHGINHLTDNGTTASGTGNLNNGADFESGNSAYLSIPDASQSGLDITGDLSVSMWIKFETVATTYLLQKGFEGNVQRSYVISWDSNTLGFQTCSDGVGGAGVNQAWTPSTATWYHICLMYTSSIPSVDMYINGTEISGSSKTTLDTPIHNGTSDFALAGASSPGAYFDGIMDEVGIWAKVLSVAEKDQLYNGGTPLAYEFFQPESKPIGTIRHITVGNGMSRSELAS